MTAIISNPETADSKTADSKTQRKRANHVIAWPLLPDEYVLPDDPVENEAQPRLAAALTNALANLPHLVDSALVVSNFALCASVDGRIICKAPDWMYISPVEPVDHIRRSYTPHTEGDIPQIVMEFLSESDCGEYSVQSGRKLGKWHFYEQIVQIPTYVIFDPASADLEVYTLKNGLYTKEAATDERFFLADLDLWIGVWEGTRDGYAGYWLRWWTPAGEMVPWPEERAKEAETQAKEAEAQAKEAEARAQTAEAENARLLAKLKAAGLE